MGFLSTEQIKLSRERLATNLTKGDTFAGLILYLSNMTWLSKNYAVADMAKFAKDADNAFFLGEPKDAVYHEKKWYALFTENWTEQAKFFFLRGKKVSAVDFAISLYWARDFKSESELIEALRGAVGREIFEQFFDDTEQKIQFNQGSCPLKKELLDVLGGNKDTLTIKYDGSFIKKRAGELSGAPFGQTLYAAAEIKKTLIVFDFDFLSHYKLNSEKKAFHAPAPKKSQKILIGNNFILLAGISGTGKTRFVREQAARFPEENNYCLVSVRPDWHEPSDLLGYISRMSETPEYVCTDTLRFIVSAWKHLIEEVTEDTKEILGWRGKSLNEIAPFWLCLDEMNLAPVEQYFADYLSVLETREWLSAEQLESYNQDNTTEHEYIYTCDPLLKSDVITTLPDESQTKMATTLGLDLDSPNDQKLWDYFCQSGIAIPFNLIVAGTVNMDETTHGFSRKVIDRALSFDFGEFFPNDFDAFFEPKTQPLTISYPVWSEGQDLNALQTSFDSDGQQSVTFLKAINTILDGTPFKLAYRALNELLINVIAAQPTNETMLLAVWDDFIMTKLLPRIEGDADKLSVQSQQADDFTNKTVLDDLLRVLADQFNAIWEGKSRPDLYRESLIEQEDSKTILIECRSKTKLEWMKKRLDSATFTSFWP